MSSKTMTPLEAVAAAQMRLELAEEKLTTTVRAAVAAGYSWADVAAMLGVTRQAAHKRFRP